MPEMQKKRRPAPARRDRPGIQSVEIASRILAAMTAAARPLPLKDIARSSAMPAAKVHRYLVSLTRTGLMAQDSADGRYGIGPAAIALGLAGLHALDVLRIASEALIGLRDASGETAVLATWSGAGPVVVRIEECSRPVFMNVRVGSTLPILRSAVGRTFVAHLPSAETAALIAKERQVRGRTARGKPLPVERLRAAAQRNGVAGVDGDLVPGVRALAAPIFDHRARIVASIALLGGPEQLSLKAESPVAVLLKDVAASISHRLGYAPVLPARRR